MHSERSEIYQAYSSVKMSCRVVILLSCLYATADAFTTNQPSNTFHHLQKVSTLSHKNPHKHRHRHLISSPSFHDTIKGIPQGRSSATKLSLLPDFLSSISLSLSESETAINAIQSSTLSVLGHDILTFLFVTVLVIPISNSLGTNPTLLFLLIGCLLGPYNLQIFSNNEADLQLGDFGILFLLFNEGLGLSPDRIKDLRAFSNLGLLQIMSSMALFFFGTLIGGPFILSFLDNFIDVGLLRPILSSPVQAFCIASAGALSSSAFVLPVLKSKGWEDRKEGIAGLSILLLQDLAVAPLLVLLPVLAGSGPQTPAEFGTLILKAVFGFGGVLVLGRYLLRYVFEIVASAKSTETFVAAALLVAIGMGQTADMLGLSASTGAFAAGVLLAGNKFRPQIQADIKPFEGILLGIFFITAGAELDPVVVIQEWPTLVLGIAGFLITKAAVLFATGPAIGLSKAEAARVAFTLAGGGEFSFVLFKLAQELGVLPEDLNKLLTASVIISMSLTPLLGDLGSKVGDYLEELNPPTKLNPWDGLTVEEAEAIFDETDKDGSGTIDLDELRTTLVKLNIPFETIANIFVAFDTNGDEEISVEEWNTGIKNGLLETALRSAPEPNTNTEILTLFEEDATVICGFGKMGRAVYSMLQEMGGGQGEIVAFTLDPSRVTAGVMSGAPVVFGDGGRYELYKAAGCKSPKAILITYGSRARRMNVLVRIRQALPNTKIYCRADDQGEYTDLLAAGADEVISESTEAVVRFGSLLNICNDQERTDELRGKLLGINAGDEPIPGYSDDDIAEIVDRTGMDIQDIMKLYYIFESLGGNKDTDVSVKALEDFLARNSDIEPLDIEALDTYLKLVDEDGEGDLSFDEFVRVSCLRSV
jgi:Kef-type K+ transport system membrane component KefB/Trk K+ transport system NAD-binding subunit